MNSVRLCCGKRHTKHDVICDDNKVMCCLCFERFDISDLEVVNGVPIDECKQCAQEEEL